MLIAIFNSFLVLICLLYVIYGYFAAIYLILGGYMATAMTDFIQGIIMIIE